MQRFNTEILPLFFSILYLHSQLHSSKTQDDILVNFFTFYSPFLIDTIPPQAIASCQPVAKRPPSIAFSAQA